MKSLFMLIVFLSTIIDVFSQTCGALKVTYEGKIYNTVQIGNQCWLKENLDVGLYIELTNKGSNHSDVFNNGIIEKYCYENNESNCATYGGLYEWNEAMGYTTIPETQGICPHGWHIPTLAEFQELKVAVSNDGNTLKSITEGSGRGAGTNRSGFSALLSGGCSSYGNFLLLGITTSFWSSTWYDIERANYLGIYENDNSIFLGEGLKDNGFSIRCIKD